MEHETILLAKIAVCRTKEKKFNSHQHFVSTYYQPIDVFDSKNSFEQISRLRRVFLVILAICEPCNRVKFLSRLGF